MGETTGEGNKNEVLQSELMWAFSCSLPLEKQDVLDINIVVVCLLHYISVKRTTVEFVVH